VSPSYVRRYISQSPESGCWSRSSVTVGVRRRLDLHALCGEVGQGAGSATTSDTTPVETPLVSSSLIRTAYIPKKQVDAETARIYRWTCLGPQARSCRGTCVLPLRPTGTGSRRCPSRPGPASGRVQRSRRLVVSSPLPAVARFRRARPRRAEPHHRARHTVFRGLFCDTGWVVADEMAAFLQDEERSLLWYRPPIKRRPHRPSLAELLELRLSIIDNPAGSEGVRDTPHRPRLAVANDGGQPACEANCTA